MDHSDTIEDTIIPLKEPLENNTDVKPPKSYKYQQGKEPQMILRLHFEPKGEGDAGNAYQMEDKEEKCVVCGFTSHLTKHHIVEYEYRQHLPESYKSHNAYDIVLLCSTCHPSYEMEAMRFKHRLAEEYEMPLQGKGWYLDHQRNALKKAASALKKHVDDLPPSRRDFLEKQCQEGWTLMYPMKEWNETSLEELASMDVLIKTEEYISHGKGVVTALGEDWLPFVLRWRLHFVETMEPRHLSPLWDPYRLDGR